ncbi:MAG: 1,2-phenylacetyl-CoA epoxidase subunit PaaC [Bacteroidota bacterium]
MNFDAIKELLYRLADDDLIMGHRNSEWTGLGPILEEDIAFSSMAQDAVGHAQAYYIILHQLLQEPAPDTIAFARHHSEFRSCHLVEHPIGGYAFSLVRHALYDTAKSIRLEALSNSSFRPLSNLAQKIGREQRYHQLHAETWLRQLGNSTQEAKTRLQNGLNEAYPLAFSLFEPTLYHDAMVDTGLQISEAELEAQWMEKVQALVLASGLQLPEIEDKTVAYGGRYGKHTAFLPPMLEEMTEVFVIDPQATW